MLSKLAAFRTLLLPGALAASLSGCLSMNSYIDPALPTVRAEELRPTRAAQPVHLLFEFRTKGAPNARGTELAKPVAFDTVRSTSLFSNVAEAPVASGRTLTIVIDNVPITEDAASKGFATGLTLGLAGSTVTDGYVCTATYSAPGVAPKKTEVKHALHTTIGNTDGPKGLTPMKPDEAFPVIVRQLTLNALKVVRRDAGL
jgi:hypothetical protein